MFKSAALALGGLCGLLISLELLFRALPVSTATMTGYHLDADLLTYPPRHEFRMATGWDLRNPQIVRANAQGFAAHRDFGPGAHAVGLIGDSYVEASMLSAHDRPGAQLEAALGATRPVFTMGGPGSSLLDYAQRLRWAARTFGVADFVLLLERGDARQAVCGSGNVHSRCVDPRTLEPRVERQPPPSALKQLVRRSALAQYMVSQVRFTPNALLGAMFSRQTPESGAAGDGAARRSAPSQADIESAHRMVDAVVDGFFAAVEPHRRGCIVFLVDGDRRAPLDLASQVTLASYERARLIERLGARGGLVVDLEPVYARHAQTSKRSLDVGPYDGHLNPLGVKLAMGAAARAMGAGVSAPGPCSAAAAAYGPRAFDAPGTLQPTGQTRQ